MSRTEAPTVGSTVAKMTQRLADGGIPDSGAEARVLVKTALRLTSTTLLTERDRPVTDFELVALSKQVERRLRREPLQYITGEVEFYGRVFDVDRRVLIPRPETELLVEQALAYITEQHMELPRILDIGTGSGVLAVTLAAELPPAEAVATDISVEALEVARSNALTHSVADRIEFAHCPFADGVNGRFDVIVCNPPYVRTEFLDGSEIQPELAFEPRTALDGGADGMEVYRPLIERLGTLLRPSSGTAFIEIDPPVTQLCLAEARQRLPQASLSVLTDLAGLERCLVIETAR